MKIQLAKAIATSLGFGYGPKAPGTFGALFGVIVYIILAYYFDIVELGLQSNSLDYLLIALIVIATAIGTWSAGVLEPEWGHDDGKIVIDETLGVWITLLFVPFSWLNVLMAFILFRFFDILKPLGVKTIDKKLHSPFSVMLDDILAGIYAALTLQLIIYCM